ncbi:hypothetical protein GOP47_0021066 [Adiantum capillus-veneris]|uniref:Uncharacterized protein n=1 Tax=Adiantum capillus-veneris TaxID=13818 RepID=A0A9D4UC77_ADICA|nr:hypothetical protein GOP47_0021066 [Adiantum capillus-veneris]
MVESGGAGPADSYIGSLISLTSKSEIRYEGLLYTVDTENSNIALQNVRSFGTEGRKNNGPQIPASDKVYEFIIFRGTDIKDLQVKSSPPPPPSIHSDPAIISLQAQVSQPAVVPPYMSPPVTDLIGNQSTYKANSVPYYHTARSGVPIWSPPPPPQVPSGSVPYYWQGFYRPQDEHRLLEPSSGLDLTPIAARGLPASVISETQSSSAPLEQNQASTQASMTSNSGSIAASHVETIHPPRVGLGTSISTSNPQPSSSSFTNAETSRILQEASDVDVPLLKPDTAKNKPFNEVHSGGSSGVSHPPISSTAQASRKSTGKSHQVYKQVYRQVQITKDTYNSGLRGTAPKSQPNSGQPLLPLPISTAQRRPSFQETVSRSNFMRRGGRGMGRPSRTAHSRSKLLEDFDFIAMNEKFNKEEVWDELLKVEYKDRVTEEGGAMQGMYYDFDTNEIRKDFDRGLSEHIKKVVYVKDDFFDSLSCDALDREHGRQERPKFAEQRRIDAETFGSHHLRNYRGGGASRGRRGGGGGRGQGRGGGRARRGYGYSGIRG